MHAEERRLRIRLLAVRRPEGHGMGYATVL